MHEHSCSRTHLSRIYVHVFMDEDSAHAHGQTHKLRQYALNNQSPDRLLGTQPLQRTLRQSSLRRERASCAVIMAPAQPQTIGTRLTWSCRFPRLAVAIRLASVPSAICGGSRILAAHHCHDLSLIHI